MKKSFGRNLDQTDGNYSSNETVFTEQSPPIFYFRRVKKFKHMSNFFATRCNMNRLSNILKPLYLV